MGIARTGMLDGIMAKDSEIYVPRPTAEWKGNRQIRDTKVEAIALGPHYINLVSRRRSLEKVWRDEASGSLGSPSGHSCIYKKLC